MCCVWILGGGPIVGSYLSPAGDVSDVLWAMGRVGLVLMCPLTSDKP